MTLSPDFYVGHLKGERKNTLRADRIRRTDRPFFVKIPGGAAKEGSTCMDIH